ncbi:MAG: ribonuclease HII [Rhodospirillales bacterium]|nr:ribonuclease HII [Rhodospirillales bacterium]
MADLTLEREAGGLVAGIDEAGRGPWAGPVVAAAVIIDLDLMPRHLADQIDDSKVLRPAKRVELAAALIPCARIGIGAASVDEIDRINILQATFLAMTRALAALGVLPDTALVDGNRLPTLPCAARAIVKGDSKSLSIAAASIVAKVTRDRIMAMLSSRYPGFGWERNAGYGTAQHRAGLAQFGVTPHHRRSYAPIRKILEIDD